MTSVDQAVPVDVAVIGVGYWGPNLVRNLNEWPGASVMLVCDRQPEALVAIRRRYPEIRVTERYEDVLSDPRIEAVVIATPVGTHYELALPALRAGKHVFVEKPLASSSAECVALIQEAHAADLVLMTGHTFLYSPPVNLIRDLVISGELGEIYFITMSRVNLGVHQSDVGVVWDLGAHDFSILRHWLNEMPERIAAMSRSCIFPHVSDVAFINLEFQSGTVAHVELAWLAPSKLRRTAIVGSKKMVVYDDTSTEPVRIFDSGVISGNPPTFGEFRLTYRAGDIISPPVAGTEPLSLEIEDFCRSIRHNKVPRSSGALALDVVRMIEAAEQSIAAGGTPIHLDELPP